MLQYIHFIGRSLIRVIHIHFFITVLPPLMVLFSSYELSNSAFKAIKYRIYFTVLNIITKVSSDYASHVASHHF